MTAIRELRIVALGALACFLCSISAMASAAAPPGGQVIVTPAPKAPPIGTVSQGFEFEGGDPAQWSSWRPVTPKAKDFMLSCAVWSSAR